VIEEQVEQIADLPLPVAVLPFAASAIIFASSRSARRVPAPGRRSGERTVLLRWIGVPWARRPTSTRKPHTPGAPSVLVPFTPGLSPGCSLSVQGYRAFIPSELVGRPGLDPGTLGLKVPCSA
jgi:hypothetical protein